VHVNGGAAASVTFLSGGSAAPSATTPLMDSVVLGLCAGSNLMSYGLPVSGTWMPAVALIRFGATFGALPAFFAGGLVAAPPLRFVAFFRVAMVASSLSMRAPGLEPRPIAFPDSATSTIAAHSRRTPTGVLVLR